jgi:hypothetical protein
MKGKGGREAGRQGERESHDEHSLERKRDREIERCPVSTRVR